MYNQAMFPEIFGNLLGGELLFYLYRSEGVKGVTLIFILR